MNIIFIGSIYPHEREAEITCNSKCGIDNASNNLQWAMLVGLDHYFSNLKVITQPFIRSFPFYYKKLFFRSSPFSHRPGATDICLGFLNIMLIKHFINAFSLYKTLQRIINKDEETTLLIYGVHTPFLSSALRLKKNNKKLKVCLIVPDLPQFSSQNRNLIYLFLKKVDSFIIQNSLSKIDSFVLLSDYMAGALKIKDRPYTRVEGIFHFKDYQKKLVKKQENKTILYTGNIDERYGINTLLKAFSLIKDANYRLWIRGDGNTKNNVLLAMKEDSRIRYFDEMPRNQLFELLQKATVLINPVSSNEEFTKYFFSSKTMDYLASGTPTIMAKLKSLPAEYINYLFLTESDNAEGLKEAILNVCSKEQLELDEFGKKASQFILECKNPIYQVKRIYEMIK